MEAWSSDAALHLGQIALLQPEGVLGHCPVDKQMIVPLTANQMGCRIAAECCGSHAVTLATALPLWCSRAPGCLSLRTPVTIMTRITVHWTPSQFDCLPCFSLFPLFHPCVSIIAV